MVGSINKTNLMKGNIADKLDFEIVNNGSILYEYEEVNHEHPGNVTVKEGKDQEMALHVGHYIIDMMDSFCASKIKIHIEII
jgi:hypothetical protein